MNEAAVEGKIKNSRAQAKAHESTGCGKINAQSFPDSPGTMGEKTPPRPGKQQRSRRESGYGNDE
jgi:hypothetical protein